ncbi:MAG: hypothetical protein ACHQIM_19185 [Sphingobacteriales bacterium]
MKYDELLEKQYKVAVDARDKLNENYHKWMTFYYVANGAILVAITNIYDKLNGDNWGIIIMTAIGVFTCTIWNASCKGYYYWSLSWIAIIMHMERELAKNNINLMPYSMFSKDVVDEFDHKNNPIDPANISTPKLTLRFSIFAIFCWSLFFIFEFLKQLSCLPVYVQSIIAIGIIIIIYGFIIILPLTVKSRVGDTHELRPFKKLREEVNQQTN